MRISMDAVVENLQSADKVLILLHQFPDGDTIGSGCALCRALQKSGKRARIACAHNIHNRYNYITTTIEMDDFEPEYIVAVDVADVKLLGDYAAVYGDKIDLCIDHHSSNTDYARLVYVDATASANCEIIYDLLIKMDGDIDYETASALYTGISTDTGCFRFSNTTAHTHTVAAQLMEKGIDCAEINRIMFDAKSRRRIELEREALSSIVFGKSERTALITITNKMIIKIGADEADLEGLTSLPRQVEGVLIGITVRERENNLNKISVRTHAPINAVEFCRHFGGGGHERAAGCEITGSLGTVRKTLLAAAEQTVADAGITGL